MKFRKLAAGPFLFSLLLPTSAFAQGALNPPGPPAPTMKTLDQIEPRRLISSLPFTISQSGSYYLTKNLNFTAASGNAITISASNVTLDLMGFTLSSSSAVTGDAIRMNAGLRNIAVRNGVIAGNTVVTVSGGAPNQSWSVNAAGFSNGINAFSSPEVSTCHFSHLRISGCRIVGLDGGEQAVAEQVTATQNGNAGIRLASGSVTNSTGLSNGGSGVACFNGSVANCSAFSNGGGGIFGYSVANCAANGNKEVGIIVVSGSVTNSSAVSNGGNGVSVIEGSVTNSTALSNGNNGIAILSGSVTNSTAISNGNVGILADACSVTNSFAKSNGSDGIKAPAGVVAFCKASENNKDNDGSVDIDATEATRTGNKPAP
jgi:hypothetical protein